MALARALDDGGWMIQSPQFPVGNLDHDAITAAGRALIDAGYVNGQKIDHLGSSGMWLIVGLTEHGLRTVGLWPSEQGAEDLIDALKHAEETTSDPEDRSVILRAISGLGAMSRDLLVDVTTAVIANQVSGPNS